MVKKIVQSVDDDLRQYGQIPNDVESVRSSLTQKASQTDLFTYINAKNASANPKRTPYLLYDSFSRADSTTSIGNAETNNTAYTLLNSTSFSLVWGIQSNQAYVVSRSGSGRSVQYQETNESDCIIECDLSGVANNGDGGLAFRITDVDNFWYATVQGSNLSINLMKYVGGVQTTVFNYWMSKQPTDGKLTILTKGNKVELYYDGFLITRAYDRFNSTATKHGLYSRGGYLGYRWTNFNVRPLSDVPFSLTETFDNGLTKWFWSTETPNMSYSQTFSTSIKESGTQSFRVELHSDDPDVSSSKRCEIKLPSENPLEEHWYGASIYLPNGGDEDFVYDTSEEILIQWHSTPDSGEQSVSPPLALRTGSGRYTLSSLYDTGRMSTQSPQTFITNNTDLGSYEDDKGKWVKWVFHVKWGYVSSQNPILEVYKDGKPVLNLNGIPNMTNDMLGVFPKLGIYKWDWHYGNPSLTTKRVVYYDNYWVK